MPLQKALRVGERAVLLHVRCRGKEKDLCADFVRTELAAHDFRRVEPERRCLGLHHVADDEPLQFAKGRAFELRVRGADRRILSHDEQPFELSVGHVQPIAEMGMVAGELRQPSESEIIFLRCRVAVVSLEQADDVLVDVVPPAFRRLVLLEIGGKVRFIQRSMRGHRQISRQDVVESWDVRGPLDRSMSAQRENSTAGPPDVAE